jgi:hypothetical protein
MIWRWANSGENRESQSKGRTGQYGKWSLRFASLHLTPTIKKRDFHSSHLIVRDALNNWNLLLRFLSALTWPWALFSWFRVDINVQWMVVPSRINSFRHKYAKAPDYDCYELLAIQQWLDSQIDLFNTHIISHVTKLFCTFTLSLTLGHMN